MVTKKNPNYICPCKRKPIVHKIEVGSESEIYKIEAYNEWGQTRYICPITMTYSKWLYTSESLTEIANCDLPISSCKGKQGVAAGLE